MSAMLDKTDDAVSKTRDIVFISKATPGDDEFVLWLAPRLEAAGYIVFADILTLEPGDRWRREITGTLQNKAVKMLLCCRDSTLDKIGVQEEIGIASDLVKELKDPRFIIPLRLESYKKLFGIGELQWIDFLGSWASGLHDLLDALEKQDVPRAAGGAAINPNWENYRKRLAIKVEKSPEVLTSNWLRVAGLPDVIHYYHPPGPINLELMERACRASMTPAEVYQRGFFSFASPEEIERDFANVAIFEIHSEHKLMDLLESGSQSPNIKPREVQNLVSSMFRRAWENFCRSKGLYEHLFSSQTAFHVGESQMPLGKRIPWGQQGQRRSSMLRNGAGGKVWQYGMSATPSFWPFPHFKLKARVLFLELVASNRAGSVIGDSGTQHRLRRTICKGWRNKAWHGRLMAFIGLLSSATPQISVPLSEVCAIVLDPRPMLFTSPVSTAISDAMGDDAEESDDSTLGMFNPEDEGLMDLPEQHLEVIHIEEPELSFGHGQTCDHPKDGLFLYGPHAAPARTREVSVGVVGTKDGLSYFRSWAIALGGFVFVPPPKKTDKANRLHLSNFPGLEEAFGLIVSPGEFVQRTVDLKALDEATRTLNQHEAVRKAVDLYVNEIERYDKNEEKTVDVWIFVLPELIFERCKPLARRSGLDLTMGEFSKGKREKSDLPLFRDVIDQTAEEIFDDVPDFHRQVKARLLKLGHTSQLIRETTLAPDKFLNRAGYPIRGLQDPATVAWNMATGLYYKTQADPPWKLAHVRPGVCYIGLVFKMIPNDPQQHACCAAQMFLNEGDAVVFRGANGPWKTGDYEFHLKAPEAKKLIAKVLETFKDKHVELPKEFFIHGRTTFSEDEWNAFEEAAPEGTNVVGVRIKETHGESKLFRNGDYPVMRGTAIILNDRNALLWTNGFVPRLNTYIGPETPNPLSVTILRSSGELPDIRIVLADIMGLTKINYNACNYNDGLPVTIRFANKVGDVLTMGSARDADRQPLKFYV